MNSTNKMSLTAFIGVTSATLPIFTGISLATVVAMGLVYLIVGSMLFFTDCGSFNY